MSVPVTGSALVDVTEGVISLEGVRGEPEDGGEAEVSPAGDMAEARLSSEREGKTAAEAEAEAADDSLCPRWLVEGLAVTPSVISAADCSVLDSTPSDEVTEAEAEAVGCCVVAGGAADASTGGEVRGEAGFGLYPEACFRSAGVGLGAAREGRMGTFDTVRVAEESSAADTERGAEGEEDTSRLTPFATHEDISVTWGAAITYADRTDRALFVCA